ncbi:MAG: helix-turn-helix domain-containing protein [Proteobacteria bacterium]|nr:helix-turn-helix domain-containing protein [Pseudomonadota bacterium]
MTSSIKKLREGLGLTQEDLAEKVGVVHTTIGRWENGREVKKKYRKKLADALGVEMANLIFEAEEIRAAKKVSDTVAVEVDVSFENVPILGTVEAGNYETAERREGDDVAYVTLPIDERCEGKKPPHTLLVRQCALSPTHLRPPLFHKMMGLDSFRLLQPHH